MNPTDLHLICQHLNHTDAAGYATAVQDLADDNARLRASLRRIADAAAVSADEFRAIGQDPAAQIAEVVAAATRAALED